MFFFFFCHVPRFCGSVVAFQPPDIADARSSSAVTAARQAEDLASNTVPQHHMIGSCPRNSHPLNLGHVWPVSFDTAGGTNLATSCMASHRIYHRCLQVLQVQQIQIGGIKPNKIVTNAMLMPPHQFGIVQVLAFACVMMVLLSPMSFGHVGGALCLFYVMQWLQDMHFDNVDFMLDSKITTDAFHTRQIEVTNFSHVIIACKHLFSTFTNFRIEFNRREANVVAHALASDKCQKGVK